MKNRKRYWIAVLGFALLIVFLLACGRQETPAPAPTKAPAAEAPAVTQPPAATKEAAAPTPAPTATQAPAATEAAAPTEAPAAPAGDAKSLIAKSAADLKGLKSYRAKIIVETEGQKMEMRYEFVKPDKFHMVSDFVEVIGIGKDVYMKVGETWTKIPGGGAETALAGISGAEAAAEGLTLTEEAILGVQPGGTEDVEGVPCQKYVYTAKLGDNPPVEFTIWIGLKDSLPHKIVTQVEGTTTTQILYDFNADITIEPPPGVE